ncbi:MAG TPA: histidine kinase, partial [Caldimonas sp.]|nr:histidine kinase [Caldimonas sp.]
MWDKQRIRESWRAWLSDDPARIGPWWAQAAWPIVFGTMCAIFFTVFAVALNGNDAATHPSRWPSMFRVSLIISLSITLSVQLTFKLAAAAIGRPRLRAWSRPRRSVYYLTLSLLGTAIGWPLGLYWALGIDVRQQFLTRRPDAVFAAIALAMLIAGLFAEFFKIKSQQIRAENQATEARLRLLQAQIEPHFLFNTLANVVSLMDADTPRAKAMLESFVDYLRASLVGFRHGTHTLGDEIDLVAAYLRIVKMRMEDRLQYTVDLAPELRAHALPPLTLQPL